jgi:hypothetical protein
MKRIAARDSAAAAAILVRGGEERACDDDEPRAFRSGPRVPAAITQAGICRIGAGFTIL